VVEGTQGFAAWLAALADRVDGASGARDNTSLST
jgi:hypothetical protein